MMWAWVLGASAIAYLTKLLGYLVPERFVSSPRVRRATSAMTIGLLAALVVTTTVASGQRLALDARLAAAVAALITLKLRAPFIVVVTVGALAAAVARALGAL